MPRKLVATALPTLVLLALAARPFLAAGPRAPLAAPRRPVRQRKTAASRKPPAIPQMIAGGLWRTDGNFHAVLMLRNALGMSSIAVTPVLYLADGTALDLTPVELAPDGVAMVDINAALAAAPAQFGGHVSAYGSAAVKCNWPWQPVLAAVRSDDDIGGMVYQMHLDADANLVQSPRTPTTQQVIESTWWKEEANIRGFLALTNTSGAAITAAVVLGDHTGTNTARQQYTLAPHATTWVDFAPLWAQLPPGDAGSIAVSYAGPMYALVANGGMEDAALGYSHMLHFYVPETLLLRERLAALPARLPAGFPLPNTHWSAHTSFDAAGIMVGSQDADMQFPRGTSFTPYLVLHNTTANAMAVELAANVMQGGAPQEVALGALQLAPLEARRIQLGALLAASPLAGRNGSINLRTRFAGSPTDLEQVSGSVDQSLNYVFEVPPRPEGPSTAALLNYWNANGETDTMFTLYNYGDAPQQVVLTLAHQAGKYELPIQLAPHASAAFSVGQLIRQGVPDRNGNIIPANIVQGSAQLAGASGSHRERLTVAIAAAIFNPRTATCYYSCITCNYAVSAYIDPEPDEMNVGDDNDLTLYVVFNDESQEDYTTDPSTEWYSDDASVAQVDQGGGVTGAGAGRTTVEADTVAPSGGDWCCTGGWCDSTAPLSADGDVYVDPRILVGLDGNAPGTDITGSSQSVVVGQWVELGANLGESTGSPSWSVGGGSTNTRIGGWTPGFAPNDIAASANPTTVYWTVPGSYSVAASFGGAQASATINVSGPSGVLESTATGGWATDGTIMELVGNNGGIELTSTMSPPPGFSNHLQWVQVLTGLTLDLNGSSCTPASGSSGLDSQNPYPYYTLSGDPIDSPDITLSASASSEQYGISAQMFMLWYPDTNGDMPVPLGYVSWDAQGAALQVGRQWSISQNNASASAFTSSSNYPTWSARVPSPQDWACGVTGTEAAPRDFAAFARGEPFRSHLLSFSPGFSARSERAAGRKTPAALTQRHSR